MKENSLQEAQRVIAELQSRRSQLEYARNEKSRPCVTLRIDSVGSHSVHDGAITKGTMDVVKILIAADLEKRVKRWKNIKSLRWNAQKRGPCKGGDELGLSGDSGRALRTPRSNKVAPHDVIQIFAPRVASRRRSKHTASCQQCPELVHGNSLQTV
jgi:hypothetical protein